MPVGWRSRVKSDSSTHREWPTSKRGSTTPLTMSASCWDSASTIVVNQSGSTVMSSSTKAMRSHGRAVRTARLRAGAIPGRGSQA